MVKQCPRCWAKLSPGDEVCPNCGFELVRKAAPESGQTDTGKRVIFPTASKKSDEWGFTLKLVYVLTLIWAVLAVAGGIYNLVAADDNLIIGLGLILSGILSGIVFYLIREREHYFVASLLLLVSGAATFQLILLVFALLLSFLLYSNGKFFKSK